MAREMNAPDCSIKKGKMINYFPFREIRQEQENILCALDKIYDSGKYRYIVIEAGTGIGKSAIAKSISKKDGSCYLLTSTKQLQDQYISDFYKDGARAVKGSANYRCEKEPQMDCRVGMCQFDKELATQCYAENSCPYIVARNEAETAEMYVASFSYFLKAGSGGLSGNEPNKNTRLSRRGAVIIDECHLMEDQLLQMVGLTLNKERLIKKYGLTDDLNFKEQIVFRKTFDAQDLETVCSWLGFVSKLAQSKLFALSQSLELKVHGDYKKMNADELTELSDKDSSDIVNQIEYLSMVVNKIKKFLQSKDKSNWVIESNDDVVKITPLEIDNLFESAIDKYAVNHVVMMSATIFDKKEFCLDLGIDPNQTAFITRDGVFDSKKSPIVYDPVGSMNYANLQKTLPAIAREVKRLLDLHKGEKGIIHTGTYAIAQYIIDNVSDDRLVYREHKETNEMLFAYHASSDKPTVLISPSLMTGVDLKDDLGRFQIVVKLPYISMADARVKKKMEKSKAWYNCKMLCNLVQECGRSTRNENDWSVTYVLDSAFANVMKYSKHLLPNSFVNRITSINNFNADDFRKKMQNEEVV